MAGGAQSGIMGVRSNGSGPADDDEAAGFFGTGNVFVEFQRTIADISTSALLKCVYRTSSGSITFYRRYIHVLPVRLSG